MKIAFFDSHRFEKEIFNLVNQDFKFEIEFLDVRLTAKTAALAKGFEVVCSFVSDKLDRECVETLKQSGIQLIALRSAGFNHVDIRAANDFKIPVCRVPSYSPNSIAEFAVGLLLTLNRKIHKAYLRTHELNFSIEGLVGFDLFGKTIGVVGAGKIGKIFAKIMSAFGCRILVNDINHDPEIKALPNCSFVDLETLASNSDVVSLHVPLTEKTLHMVNSKFISLMKNNAIIINTGRGALIDARALIDALKMKKIGGAALDVYEEEEGVFFQDLSSHGLDDDKLARLLTFPNVLMTSHQGFLTNEALQNIARTTLESIEEFGKNQKIPKENKVNLF